MINQNSKIDTECHPHESTLLFLQRLSLRKQGAEIQANPLLYHSHLPPVIPALFFVIPTLFFVIPTLFFVIPALSFVIPALFFVIPALFFVIPAEAGIQVQSLKSSHYKDLSK